MKNALFRINFFSVDVVKQQTTVLIFSNISYNKTTNCGPFFLFYLLLPSRDSCQHDAAAAVHVLAR